MIKLNKDLLSFFKDEQDVMRKSNTFMKRIYKNRIEDNLGKDREALIFLFDKIGYYYHNGTATSPDIEKLLFGFRELAGKKEINNGLKNILASRKANLPD